MRNPLTGFLKREIGRTERTLCFTLALAIALTSLPAPSLWAQSIAAPSAFNSSTNTPLNLATLDLNALAIPETLGRVVEGWQPATQVPSGFVIHIQDLHTHEEAQTNISQLLGEFHDRLGIQLVAHEGAEGLCDTTAYSELPDPPTTERVARLFMEEGLFTGAEYYAITHPGYVTLWGVEDDAIYREHVQTYQHSRKQLASAEATLSQLHDALEPLQARVYPRPIQQLLKLQEGAERDAEEGAFRAYFKELVRLARETKRELSIYPHIRALAQAYELSDRLDMRAVEADHSHLVETLLPKLNQDEQRQLRHFQRALSAHEISETFYYEMLARLAKSHGVLGSPSQNQPSLTQSALLLMTGRAATRPRDYRALRQYLAYLKLTNRIRTDALKTELETLHELVEDASFTTEEQRALASLLRHLNLLDDLAHVKLSPAHWATYQRRRPELTAEGLWHALTLLTANAITRLQHTADSTQHTEVKKSDLEELIASLQSLERFYELALQRDDALVRNTLHQLEAQPIPAAILIAGGFHTPGITERLKARNVAYLVIAPTVTQPLDEATYQARLHYVIPSADELMQQLDAQTLLHFVATNPASPVARAIYDRFIELCVRLRQQFLRGETELRAPRLQPGGGFPYPAPLATERTWQQPLAHVIARVQQLQQQHPIALALGLTLLWTVGTLTLKLVTGQPLHLADLGTSLTVGAIAMAVTPPGQFPSPLPARTMGQDKAGSRIERALERADHLIREGRTAEAIPWLESVDALFAIKRLIEQRELGPEEVRSHLRSLLHFIEATERQGEDGEWVNFLAEWSLDDFSWAYLSGFQNEQGHYRIEVSNLPHALQQVDRLQEERAQHLLMTAYQEAGVAAFLGRVEEARTNFEEGFGDFTRKTPAYEYLVRQLIAIQTYAVPALVERLQQPAFMNRVIGLLGASRDSRAVAPLVALLEALTQRPPQTGAEAEEDLQAASPDTLNSSDWVLIRQIVFALGELRNPQAVEPLLGLLDHPIGYVGEAVIKALVQLNDQRAVEPLIRLAMNEPISPVVREEAVWALGELKGAQAVGPLEALLTDPTPRVLSTTLHDGVVRALLRFGPLGYEVLKRALTTQYGYPIAMEVIRLTDMQDLSTDGDPMSDGRAAMFALAGDQLAEVLPKETFTDGTPVEFSAWGHGIIPWSTTGRDANTLANRIDPTMYAIRQPDGRFLRIRMGEVPATEWLRARIHTYLADRLDGERTSTLSIASRFHLSDEWLPTINAVLNALASTSAVVQKTWPWGTTHTIVSLVDNRNGSYVLSSATYRSLLALPAPSPRGTIDEMRKSFDPAVLNQWGDTIQQAFELSDNQAATVEALEAMIAALSAVEVTVRKWRPRAHPYTTDLEQILTQLSIARERLSQQLTARVEDQLATPSLGRGGPTFGSAQLPHVALVVEPMLLLMVSAVAGAVGMNLFGWGLLGGLALGVPVGLGTLSAWGVVKWILTPKREGSVPVPFFSYATPVTVMSVGWMGFLRGLLWAQASGIMDTTTLTVIAGSAAVLLFVTLIIPDKSKLDYLAKVTLVPVLEEVVFRLGFFDLYYTQWLHSPLVGAFIVIMVFTVIHMFEPGRGLRSGFIYALLSSLFLGGYVVGKGLLPLVFPHAGLTERFIAGLLISITFHAIWNFNEAMLELAAKTRSPSAQPPTHPADATTSLRPPHQPRIAFGASRVMGLTPLIWKRLMPWLRRHGLSDRQIAALGGVEELLYAGLIVGASSLGLHHYAGIHFWVAGLVMTFMSLLIFFLGHAKESYHRKGERLVLEPTTALDFQFLSSFPLLVRVPYLFVLFLQPWGNYTPLVALPIPILLHAILNWVAWKKGLGIGISATSTPSPSPAPAHPDQGSVGPPDTTAPLPRALKAEPPTRAPPWVVLFFSLVVRKLLNQPLPALTKLLPPPFHIQVRYTGDGAIFTFLAGDYKAAVVYDIVRSSTLWEAQPALVPHIALMLKQTAEAIADEVVATYPTFDPVSQAVITAGLMQSAFTELSDEWSRHHPGLKVQVRLGVAGSPGSAEALQALAKEWAKLLLGEDEATHAVFPIEIAFPDDPIRRRSIEEEIRLAGEADWVSQEIAGTLALRGLTLHRTSKASASLEQTLTVQRQEVRRSVKELVTKRLDRAPRFVLAAKWTQGHLPEGMDHETLLKRIEPILSEQGGALLQHDPDLVVVFTVAPEGDESAVARSAFHAAVRLAQEFPGLSIGLDYGDVTTGTVPIGRATRSSHIQPGAVGVAFSATTTQAFRIANIAGQIHTAGEGLLVSYTEHVEQFLTAFDRAALPYAPAALTARLLDKGGLNNTRVFRLYPVRQDAEKTMLATMPILACVLQLVEWARTQGVVSRSDSVGRSIQHLPEVFGEWLELEPSQALITEGAVNEFVYLVVKGSLVATRTSEDGDGHSIIWESVKGLRHIAGEMTAVRLEAGEPNVVARATVRAGQGKTVVLRIPIAHFREQVLRDPVFREIFALYVEAIEERRYVVAEEFSRYAHWVEAEHGAGRAPQPQPVKIEVTETAGPQGSDLVTFFDEHDNPLVGPIALNELPAAIDRATSLAPAVLTVRSAPSITPTPTISIKEPLPNVPWTELGWVRRVRQIGVATVAAGIALSLTASPVLAATSLDGPSPNALIPLISLVAGVTTAAFLIAYTSMWVSVLRDQDKRWKPLDLVLGGFMTLGPPILFVLGALLMLDLGILTGAALSTLALQYLAATIVTLISWPAVRIGIAAGQDALVKPGIKGLRKLAKRTQEWPEATREALGTLHHLALRNRIRLDLDDVTPADADVLEFIALALRRLPTRLMADVRVPVTFKLSMFRPTDRMIGWAYLERTSAPTQVDLAYARQASQHANFKGIFQIVAHEVIGHKVALSSTLRGQAPISARAFKVIAKHAGFQGVVSPRGHFIPIDAMPDDYKALRRIHNDAWVRMRDGKPIVLVSTALDGTMTPPGWVRRACARLKIELQPDRGVVYRIKNPKEVIAYVAEEYMWDSTWARSRPIAPATLLSTDRYTQILNIVRGTLFVYHDPKEEVWKRYEFRSDGTPIGRRLTQDELKSYRAWQDHRRGLLARLMDFVSRSSTPSGTASLDQSENSANQLTTTHLVALSITPGIPPPTQPRTQTHGVLRIVLALLGLALLACRLGPSGYLPALPSLLLSMGPVLLATILLYGVTAVLGHPVPIKNLLLMVGVLFGITSSGVLKYVPALALPFIDMFGPLGGQIATGLVVAFPDLGLAILLAVLSVPFAGEWTAGARRPRLSLTAITLWTLGEELAFRGLLYPFVKHWLLSMPSLIEPHYLVGAALMIQAMAFAMAHVIYLALQLHAIDSHRRARTARELSEEIDSRRTDTFYLLSLMIGGLLYGTLHETLGPMGGWIPVASIVAHLAFNFVPRAVATFLEAPAIPSRTLGLAAPGEGTSRPDEEPPATHSPQHTADSIQSPSMEAERPSAAEAEPPASGASPEQASGGKRVEGPPAAGGSRLRAGGEEPGDEGAEGP